MEVTMQRKFNDDVPMIVNASEPHMACLLLLATSGSMAGEPIAKLNAGLNQFKTEVCEDKTIRDILDIAIVEFNSTHRVVQEFVPIEYMESVNLQAGGVANMSLAIQTAIDMVNERSRFYRRCGIEPYEPWIIMISDGAPQDDISGVVSVIQEMEENGKLKFFSLGVQGYDSQTLHRLSGPKVMKLKGYDFSSFFNWVNKSMNSTMFCARSAGRSIKVPLPENVDRDTAD